MFSWHTRKLLTLIEIADKHDVVGKVVEALAKLANIAWETPLFVS